MNAFLKQLTGIIGAFVILYAMILIATYLIAPPEKQTDGLDAGGASGTIFMTEPKYVFLNYPLLQPHREKIVLLGGSNVVVGLKPRQLQPLLKNAEVNNLGIGGSNVTQLTQIHDLIDGVQDAEARRHTIYVIGMWYGLFAANKMRWYSADRVAGDTDIDIERYRYGFWRRSSSGPVRAVEPALLNVALAVIRPYLLLDRLIRNATTQLRNKLHHPDQEIRTDEQRDATVLTEEEKMRDLDYWRTAINEPDTLEDEQFVILDQLVEKILSAGEAVVLVDLPLPRWHAERSPYYKDYLKHRREIAEKFRSRPNFYMLDLHKMDNDLDFSDEVHPKPRVTTQWVDKLADFLHPVIAENISASATQAGN